MDRAGSCKPNGIGVASVRAYGSLQRSPRRTRRLLSTLWVDVSESTVSQ